MPRPEDFPSGPTPEEREALDELAYAWGNNITESLTPRSFEERIVRARERRGLRQIARSLREGVYKKLENGTINDTPAGETLGVIEEAETQVLQRQVLEEDRAVEKAMGNPMQFYTVEDLQKKASIANLAQAAGTGLSAASSMVASLGGVSIINNPMPFWLKVSYLSLTMATGLGGASALGYYYKARSSLRREISRRGIHMSEYKGLTVDDFSEPHSFEGKLNLLKSQALNDLD